jgi:hypothetical protein
MSSTSGRVNSAPRRVCRQQDEHRDVGASINMNIIYIECKLFDITKRGFDFIGMSDVGGVLCFLLCSIQMTVGVSSIQMKNSSQFCSNVVTSISSSFLVQI